MRWVRASLALALGGAALACLWGARYAYGDFLPLRGYQKIHIHLMASQEGLFLGMYVVLGGLANVLNPELCCVSGGMINAGEMLFGPMRESVREHSFPLPGGRLKIVPAQLGEPAGIIGAAGCALTRSATSR